MLFLFMPPLADLERPRSASATVMPKTPSRTQRAAQAAGFHQLSFSLCFPCRCKAEWQQVRILGLAGSRLPIEAEEDVGAARVAAELDIFPPCASAG